jgi:hypothetical protein
LFAGDMLFYYNGEQSNLLVNMASVSSERIIASGVCALIAAWLYTLAAGQVYYGFQPEKSWVRWTAFLSFGMIMIAYGVVHGAYVAIATSAQNAAETGASPEALSALAIAANQALRNIVYVPFAIFTIVFIFSVWMKRTHYPRWMIFFSPIAPFLLQSVIVGHLEGKTRTIIGGGYLNLILLLFFASSTIVLYGSGNYRKET